LEALLSISVSTKISSDELRDVTANLMKINTKPQPPGAAKGEVA